jgi:hypothetical protein
VVCWRQSGSSTTASRGVAFILVVTEAAEAVGPSAGLLRARLAAGWSIADALTKPLDPRGPKRRRPNRTDTEPV